MVLATCFIGQPAIVGAHTHGITSVNIPLNDAEQQKMASADELQA